MRLRLSRFRAKGLLFRPHSACPYSARNSLNQNFPSSGSSSNMRDAEDPQPWRLQGNGLVRVLGAGPSSSAERLQADGARVTKLHRRQPTRSNKSVPKITAPQRNCDTPEPVERFRGRAGRLNTSAPNNLNLQRRPETAAPSETVWRVEIKSCSVQTCSVDRNQAAPSETV